MEIDEKAYLEATQEWEFSDTDYIHAGSEAWVRDFLRRYEAAKHPYKHPMDGGCQMPKTSIDGHCYICGSPNRTCNSDDTPEARRIKRKLERSQNTVTIDLDTGIVYSGSGVYKATQNTKERLKTKMAKFGLPNATKTSDDPTTAP